MFAWVKQLRMMDVMSIAENEVRSKIIMRLDEAGKAAYSDLLDSAGIVGTLDSRGNFNYHLNFLLENLVVVKDGAVYSLTDKGRAIAKFLREVNTSWKQIEPKLRGGYVDVVGYAEDFERDSEIRMRGRLEERTFDGRIENVADEDGVICVFDEKECDDQFFGSYEEIQMADLRGYVKFIEWKGESHNAYVLGHQDLPYYFSPRYLGCALHYLQRNFGEAHLFADKKKVMPLMLRATKMSERYDGPAFMIAPITIE